MKHTQRTDQCFITCCFCHSLLVPSNMRCVRYKYTHTEHATYKIIQNFLSHTNAGNTVGIQVLKRSKLRSVPLLYSVFYDHQDKIYYNVVSATLFGNDIHTERATEKRSALPLHHKLVACPELLLRWVLCASC